MANYTKWDWSIK